MASVHTHQRVFLTNKESSNRHRQLQLFSPGPGTASDAQASPAAAWADHPNLSANVYPLAARQLHMGQGQNPNSRFSVTPFCLVHSRKSGGWGKYHGGSFPSALLLKLGYTGKPGEIEWNTTCNCPHLSAADFPHAASNPVASCSFLFVLYHTTTVPANHALAQTKDLHVHAVQQHASFDVTKSSSWALAHTLACIATVEVALPWELSLSLSLFLDLSSLSFCFPPVSFTRFKLGIQKQPAAGWLTDPRGSVCKVHGGALPMSSKNSW